MNKKIQQFLQNEEWDKLYNYLIDTELPIEELNDIYSYNYDDESDFSKSLKQLDSDHEELDSDHEELDSDHEELDSDHEELEIYHEEFASLLTICVQRRKVGIVKFLLKRGCNLTPHNGLHPLETLFNHMFFYSDIDYQYEGLTNARLELIILLLTHALEKNINMELERIPLKIEPRSLCFILQGNMYKESYLQLICAGSDLVKETESNVFKIIELLIANGARIEHKDARKYTIIDYISEPKILNKLLAIADFSLDFIKDHIRRYKEAIEKKITHILEPCQENPEALFKDKLNILYKYLFNKFVKKSVIQEFVYQLPNFLWHTENNENKDINIELSADAEQAFMRYLTKEDILNLSFTCKTMYEPRSHVARINKTRSFAESAKCIIV